MLTRASSRWRPADSAASAGGRNTRREDFALLLFPSSVTENLNWQGNFDG